MFRSRVAAPVALLVAVLSVSSLHAATAAGQAMADEVIVGFAPGTTHEQRAAARASVAPSEVDSVTDGHATKTQELTVAAAGDATIATLEAQPGVAWAEPVYPTQADYAPPNSGFGDQWDLFNNGRTGGTPDDDLDADRAWDLVGPGSPSVLVGIADSGEQDDHPGFAGVDHWRPSGPQTGDDHAPGCVMDNHGCDAVTRGAHPDDENGHGTAVAGLIFSNWTATNPYAGLAPASELISAKVLDRSGAGTTAQLASGMDFLADAGARVVNVSVSGPYSQAVHNVIAVHPETLFVTSSGNAGTNLDSRPSYPCSDPAPNVLCVASNDINNNLSSFSNYGAQSVDLAAPGQAVPTLSLGGGTGTFSGTSFAAPLVTGIAALAFAAAPTASAETIKTMILWGADGAPSLTGKVATGGSANAYNTIAKLKGLDVTPRPAVAMTQGYVGAPGVAAEPGTFAAALGAPTTTPSKQAGASATHAHTSVQLRASAKRKGAKAISAQLTCVVRTGCDGIVRLRGDGIRDDVHLHLASTRSKTVVLTVKRAAKLRTLTVSTGSGDRTQILNVPVRKR